MSNRHRPTSLHPDFTEDTHILIGRSRVPVCKTDTGLPLLSPEYLHREHIRRADMLGDIQFELAEGACQILTVGNLPAIEPYVGTVADTVEGQYHMLTFFQRRQAERRTVPPTRLKLFPVDTLIVSRRKCLGFDAVGCKYPHQR